nr:hypothetical protein CFP56_65163 [Quercus suber]
MQDPARSPIRTLATNIAVSIDVDICLPPSSCLSRIDVSIAFPVSRHSMAKLTSFRGSSKRPNHGTKLNVHAFLPVLGAHVKTALVEERTIPGRGYRDTSGESAREIGEPDAQGRILHAQGLETQAGDGAHVADTLLALPSHPRGQIDLFEQGQARDEVLRQAVGIGPVAQTFTPGRRVVRRGGLVGLGAAVGQGVGGIGIGRAAIIDAGLGGGEQRQCRQCGRLEERHAVRKGKKGAADHAMLFFCYKKTDETRRAIATKGAVQEEIT